MPGRFFLTETVNALAARFGATVDGIDTLPARHNIAPGQEIAVLSPDRRLSMMRWGIIPVGRKNARGRPVMVTLINVRGETVFDKSAFEGLGRAIVPANGWYEWTGDKRRKTAWRIRLKLGGPLAFAAVTDVWTAPGGRRVPQVATVTCAPNADIRDIHHRMGVILAPEDIATWLDGDDTVAARLLRPAPDGTLHIEEARETDWSAP